MERVISESELDKLSDRALCDLFRQVSVKLAKSEPGSAERACHAASLRRIARTLRHRRSPRPVPPRPPKPPGP